MSRCEKLKAVSTQSTGALYGIAAPSREVARADDWNTMLVTARGSRIEVTMNGLAVLNVNLDNWTVAGQNPDGTTNRMELVLFAGVAAGRLQHTGAILAYGLFPPALLLMQVALDRRSLPAAAGFAVLALGDQLVEPDGG